MRIGSRRYVVEWGHLLLVLGIAVVVVAYLLDARSVSLRTNNLLLVQPASLFALVLVAMVLPQCVRRADAAAAGEADDVGDKDPSQGDPSRAEFARFAALAGSLALFVLAMEWIGFDVGAWLFTAVGLFICGERRPLVLLLFPIVFATLVVLGFKSIIPFPFATSVL